jgi:hypothetical protein
MKEQILTQSRQGAERRALRSPENQERLRMIRSILLASWLSFRDESNLGHPSLAEGISNIV